MYNLKLTEIIDNMIDELNRARSICGLVVEDFDNELEKCSGEDGEANMLCSDIDAEWDRMHELKERIEFALILAVYAGYKNALTGFKYNCENAKWREKYINFASEVELGYDGNDSERTYDIAKDLVNKLFYKNL